MLDACKLDKVQLAVFGVYCYTFCVLYFQLGRPNHIVVVI